MPNSNTFLQTRSKTKMDLVYLTSPTKVSLCIFFVQNLGENSKNSPLELKILTGYLVEVLASDSRAEMHTSNIIWFEDDAVYDQRIGPRPSPRSSTLGGTPARAGRRIAIIAL